MMAGELRWLRTTQPNYILIVWQPSQARLGETQACFSHWHSKGCVSIWFPCALTQAQRKGEEIFKYCCSNNIHCQDWEVLLPVQHFLEGIQKIESLNHNITDISSFWYSEFVNLAFLAKNAFVSYPHTWYSEALSAEHLPATLGSIP